MMRDVELRLRAGRKKITYPNDVHEPGGRGGQWKREGAGKRN